MPLTVVVGSAPVDRANLLRLCRSAAQVICADGGAGSALAAGITPTAVLGDFDSLSGRDRHVLEAMQVTLYQHNPEKDQTDLELALLFALEREADQIVLTGVLGGRRTDHALGNLLLLTLESLAAVDVIIDEGYAEACLARGRRELYGSPGEYVSLLPISHLVEGVTTEGLRYPLREEPLTRGHTRGVSNEFLDVSASISVQSGTLLIIHERSTAESGN